MTLATGSENLKLDIWSCLRSILSLNISRLRTFSSLHQWTSGPPHLGFSYTPEYPE